MSIDWEREKELKKRTPASFLLVNSKGRPDFIMTMLVVVIVAFLAVIVFWMGLNAMVILMHAQPDTNADAATNLMNTFNEQAQLIILGLASSVFTLAGAYYLRRSSYDKHFAEREKTQLEKDKMQQIGGVVSTALAGFVENQETTLNHPNYDDEEEDI